MDSTDDDADHYLYETIDDFLNSKATRDEDLDATTYSDNLELHFNKPGFDLAIIVLDRSLITSIPQFQIPFQSIHSLTTHVIYLPDVTRIKYCIRDLKLAEVLYAIVVNRNSRESNEYDVYILNTIIEHHRRMFFKDVMILIDEDLKNYQNELGKMFRHPARIPHPNNSNCAGFIEPTSDIRHFLCLLFDHRMLDNDELIELRKFIQLRKEAIEKLGNRRIDYALNDRPPPPYQKEKHKFYVYECTPPIPTHQSAEEINLCLRAKPELMIDIEEFKGPCRAYSTMRGTVLSSLEYKVEYIDQTLIPNSLKLILEARRLVIAHINSVDRIPVNVIVGPLNSSVYVHIAKGPVDMMYIRENCGYGFSMLMNERSYKITQADTDKTSFYLITTESAVVAFDIIETLPEEILDDSLQQQEAYYYDPPLSVRSKTISFLRKSMTLNEIRERIVFMAIECATCYDNKFVPISVAVLNYNGKVLMDYLICPRQSIKCYFPSINRLENDDLIGTNDMEKVKRELKVLLRGKIIVGHDLRVEQKAFDIDLKSIAGIRDLQGSETLTSIMPKGKTEWKLDSIAAFLKTKRLSKVHTAFDKVSVVKEIYYIIGKIWKDTPRDIVNGFKDEEEVPMVMRSRLKMSNDLWLKETTNRSRKDERKENIIKCRISELHKLRENPSIPIGTDSGLQEGHEAWIKEKEARHNDTNSDAQTCETKNIRENQFVPIFMDPRLQEDSEAWLKELRARMKNGENTKSIKEYRNSVIDKLPKKSSVSSHVTQKYLGNTIEDRYSPIVRITGMSALIRTSSSTPLEKKMKLLLPSGAGDI